MEWNVKEKKRRSGYRNDLKSCWKHHKYWYTTTRTTILYTELDNEQINLLFSFVYLFAGRLLIFFLFGRNIQWKDFLRLFQRLNKIFVNGSKNGFGHVKMQNEIFNNYYTLVCLLRGIYWKFFRLFYPVELPSSQCGIPTVGIVEVM